MIIEKLEYNCRADYAFHGKKSLRFGYCFAGDVMQMKKRTRVNSHNESSRELFAEDKFPTLESWRTKEICFYSISQSYISE